MRRTSFLYCVPTREIVASIDLLRSSVPCSFLLVQSLSQTTVLPVVRSSRIESLYVFIFTTTWEAASALLVESRLSDFLLKSDMEAILFFKSSFA